MHINILLLLLLGCSVEIFLLNFIISFKITFLQVEIQYNDKGLRILGLIQLAVAPSVENVALYFAFIMISITSFKNMKVFLYKNLENEEESFKFLNFTL